MTLRDMCCSVTDSEQIVYGAASHLIERTAHSQQRNFVQKVDDLLAPGTQPLNNECNSNNTGQLAMLNSAFRSKRYRLRVRELLFRLG